MKADGPTEVMLWLALGLANQNSLMATHKSLCYLCRQSVQVLLYRTVWICRTAWPRQPQGCDEEESGPGSHEGWLTGGTESHLINMVLYILYKYNHSTVIVIVCWVYWLLIDQVYVTSLHTSMVPKTTCRPSKKLSPIRMTVAPPVVQPSLGLMALIQGVAAGHET